MRVYRPWHGKCLYPLPFNYIENIYCVSGYKIDHIIVIRTQRETNTNSFFGVFHWVYAIFFGQTAKFFQPKQKKKIGKLLQCIAQKSNVFTLCDNHSAICENG